MGTSSGVPAPAKSSMDKIVQQPHEASTAILNELKYNSVLDAGCGTNPELAKYVIARGAKYYGLDNGTDSGKKPIQVANTLRQTLESFYWHKNTKPFSVYNGDVRKIPVEVPTCNVGHMRFVLMRMRLDDQILAVQQLASRSNQHLLLMEHDWNAFGSTHHHKAHIELFRQYMIAFMHKARINPFVGKDLENIAKKATSKKTFYCPFGLPEENYIPWIIEQCRAQKKLAAELKLHDMSQKFGELAEMFQYFATRNVEITFTPPTICTVTMTL